jgi:hypothetical protein
MNRHFNKHSSAANNSWLLDLTYALLRITRWMTGNDLHLKPVPVVIRKGHHADLTEHRELPEISGIPHFSLYENRPSEASQRQISRQVSSLETGRRRQGKQ